MKLQTLIVCTSEWQSEDSAVEEIVLTSKMAINVVIPLLIPLEENLHNGEYTKITATSTVQYVMHAMIL